MKKYALLIACLLAMHGSTRADHARRLGLSNCLGDAAYRKASGQSLIELEMNATVGDDRHLDRAYAELSRLSRDDVSGNEDTDMADRNNQERERELARGQANAGGPASSESGRSFSTRWSRAEGSGWRFGERLGDAAYSKASSTSEVELQRSGGERTRVEVSDNHEDISPVAWSDAYAAGSAPEVSTSTGSSESDLRAEAEITESTTPELPSGDFRAEYKDDLVSDTGAVPPMDLDEPFLGDDSPAQGTAASSETGSGKSNDYGVSTDVSTTSAPAEIYVSPEPNVGVAIPARAADRDLGARIMRDLTSESPENTITQAFTSESLRNVEIKSANGKITLDGAVRSDLERMNLESRVKQMPGVISVDNQLRVVPSLGLEVPDIGNPLFSVPPETVTPIAPE